MLTGFHVFMLVMENKNWRVDFYHQILYYISIIEDFSFVFNIQTFGKI